MTGPFLHFEETDLLYECVFNGFFCLFVVRALLVVMAVWNSVILLPLPLEWSDYAQLIFKVLIN